MITRDVWLTLSKDVKKSKMVEALTQLHTIDNNSHPISGKNDQGRLANVKKDFETFVLNAAEWESKILQVKK